MALQRLAMLSLGAVVLLLQACTTSSSPAILPPLMLYASNNSGTGAVAILSLPLTSASASTGALANVDANPRGMCVSPAGLLVLGASQNLEVWSAPANGAAPSFTVALGANAFANDCAFDAAGDLYVANDGAPSQNILVYSAFSQGSAQAAPITSGVAFPFGVTADVSGDVFVANATNITEYSPLSAGNALLHTFGVIHNAEGLKIGPDGNLYVANGATTGKVDVFVPTFTNSSTFDHQLAPPNATLITYFAFDRGRNLYVSASTTSGFSAIYVYTPPYAGTPLEVDVADVDGIAIR